MAPIRLLGFLLLLLVCLSYVRSGEAKKTIKIHVPYYVKHIHHYKKVYVPKVQVVKHEHLHKKEHEHHHHHDHGHHHHHGGYDKSDGGHHSEEYDSYYDDNHRRYNDDTPISNRLPKSRGNQHYRNKWRDEPSSEETSSSSQEYTSSEEDDYISDEDDGRKGTLPAPLATARYRLPPMQPSRAPFKRTVRRRIAIVPTEDTTTLFISPSAKTIPRTIITKVTT